MHAAMEALQTLLEVLNDKIRELEKKQRHLEELKAMRSQRHDEIATIVTLNLRGTTFEIEKDILTKLDGSYFDVMLSVGVTITDEKEANIPVYFIDRSYEGFERIISNMGGNELTAKGMNRNDIEIVYRNLFFFNIILRHKRFSLCFDIKVYEGLYAMINLGDGRLCMGFSNGNINIIDIEGSVQARMVLSGHNKEVRCLALLPDGRLCSGSYDKTIKIWNMSIGQCEMTLIGHTNCVLSLDVLSDTRICGSADDTVKIWNTLTAECEVTLTGHRDYVCSVLILADGRICSGSYDNSIKIGSLESGVCEITLTGHTSYVFVVIQLQDGRICSGTHDGTIMVWNIYSNICECTLTGHISYVRSLVELFDGRLCSGSNDGTIRLWSIDDGVCEQMLTGHTGAVRSVLQLQDGRICSASGDGIIKIWS